MAPLDTVSSKSGVRPFTSAVKRMVFESGAHSKPVTQSSNCGVRIRVSPVSRSRRARRKRSDSKPGVFWVRQARKRPSGENWGEPSQPRFPAVTFVGVASASGEPSTGTVQTSVFVEDAALSSRFEVKTSSFPSGEKAKPREPPRSQAGASKPPGVRSTRVLLSRSRRRTCETLPSRQKFQWRKRSWSARWALSVPFSRASSSSRLQAASAPQSGHTFAEKAIAPPSGAQAGAAMPPGKLVRFSGSPAPMGMSQSCASPVRVETKARVRPSGEKAGAVSVASDAVSR